ncbi:hypothetical protein FACUT_11379 [Fusarium acutatum]|uniref:Clr5 domain-containing protein n=1 Tax=Fusarium acutatum TaxID=78861 RepID=A0A8H4JDL4_9HYPO|nr:hypothetical protein FACUT_11379 [Fusarium acutatum]
MAHNHPGESAYSREQWKAIHPMFRSIYIDQGYSLEKTLMVLELINNFKATEEAFRNRIKKNWRDCAKNNRVARGNRTRPKSIAAMFPDLPDYIASSAVGAVPRSISFQRFQNHFQVLHSLDKYIKGFFDTSPSRLAQQSHGTIQDTNGAEKEESEQKPAIGGRWCRALSVCQEISVLPRKKGDFIVSSRLVKDKVSKKVFKQKGIKEIQEITTKILNEKVFTRLEVNDKESTPKDLPALWSVCRLLRGLSSQLGYPEDSQALLMRLFLNELREAFTRIVQGSNTEMGRTLELVQDIPLADLKDIATLSCLCSARALSSRLEPHDPVVLEAWADYYQHHDRSKLKKDVFLAHYKRAYEEARARYETTGDGLYDERTLLILINYSYAAYYICHEKALAEQLSSELWEQTGALLAEQDPPKSWSVKVQGMAQAAKMQALLCFAEHEDKFKRYDDLRKTIHNYNLGNTHTREQYLDEIPQVGERRHEIVCLPPYDLEVQHSFGIQQVVQKLVLSPDLGFRLLAIELQDLFATLLKTETMTMAKLSVATSKLDASNDQDCQLLAAGLYEQQDPIITASRRNIHSLVRSARILFRKAEVPPLKEMEQSNLKRYLEISLQRMKAQGKECHLKAKTLRGLVVNFDSFVKS